jgi:hypothetical protein
VRSQVRGEKMGWRGKKHETEHEGSISVVPCELVVGGDVGRW